MSDIASGAPKRRATSPPLVTTVEEVERLTPQLVRIVVTGEDLREFGAGEFTDHYVKLAVPPQGAEYSAPFDAEDIKARFPEEQWPRTRTYTVSSWDPETLRLAIDFVVHGDTGVAGPWAAAAKPGDKLQMAGPGGAYTPDPDADWHLLAGDASVIPAISASLERIPAGVPAHVFIEVDGPEEELELESSGDLHLTWLHRKGSGADIDELLTSAVRELEFPEGSVHAFVHGEASSVRAMRKHLLGDRGLNRERISISGYWKRTLTEEGWRDAKQEWARLAEQDLAS